MRAAAAGVDLADRARRHRRRAAVLPVHDGVAASRTTCARTCAAWAASILSALERRDAEEMSRVRATQEVALLEAVRVVKTSQLDEAKANRAALETSRDMARSIRRDYYASREFMNAAEIVGLALSGGALDGGGRRARSWTCSRPRPIAFPTSRPAPPASAGRRWLTADHRRRAGRGMPRRRPRARCAASPPSSTRAPVWPTPWAATSAAATTGTSSGGRPRRRSQQLDRQLIAADIRIAVAEQELDAHDQQIDDAKTTSELLASKFTNRELYDWILSQLSTTYFQAYQLAYDLAKRASKAYAFELGTRIRASSSSATGTACTRACTRATSCCSTCAACRPSTCTATAASSS